MLVAFNRPASAKMSQRASTEAIRGRAAVVYHAVAQPKKRPHLLNARSVVQKNLSNARSVVQVIQESQIWKQKSDPVSTAAPN